MIEFGGVASRTNGGSVDHFLGVISKNFVGKSITDGGCDAYETAAFFVRFRRKFRTSESIERSASGKINRFPKFELKNIIGLHAVLVDTH